MKSTLIRLISVTLTCVVSLAVNAVDVSQLKDQLRQAQNDTIRGRVLLDLASQYRHTYPDTSRMYADSAYKLGILLENDSILAESCLKLSMLYGRNGMYTVSYDYALEGYKLAEQFGVPDLHARGCLSMGNAHLEMSEWDRSRTYFKECEEILLNSGDKELLAYCYSAFGNTYYYEERFSEALTYYEKSTELALLFPGERVVAFCYANLANCLRELGRFEEARGYFTKAKDFYLDKGHTSSLYLYYLNMGRVEFAEGNYEKAIEYYNSCINFGQGYMQMEDAVYAYEGLAQVFAAKNDFRSAYMYQLKHEALGDSLNNEKVRVKVALMEAQHSMDKIRKELSEKRRKLKLAEYQSEIQDQKLKIQTANNRLLWLGIIALIVILSVVFYGYKQVKRAYLYRKERQQAIEEKNRIAEQALEQKQILMREIHHRTKNNLQIISSLLSLQQTSMADNSAAEAMKACQRRINTIAVLHEKLYQNQDVGTVDIKQYLDSLVEQQVGYLGDSSIKYSVTGDHHEVQMDTAVSLGLIINELITNSLKHAFTATSEKSITLTIDQKPNDFSFTYQDSGQGMPHDFEQKKSKSLGFEIIDSLTRQLNGKLTYRFKNGSEFRLSFPSLS